MSKDSKHFLAGLDSVMREDTNRRGTSPNPKMLSLDYYDNRRDTFPTTKRVTHQGTFGKWENDDE